MKTVFGFVLIIGFFIIIISMSSIDNKFPIMVGAIVGGTVAFIIGKIIIYLRNKKNR
jgi:tetrahydromethanopterin S-methyltransferase subunit C